MLYSSASSASSSSSKALLRSIASAIAEWSSPARERQRHETVAARVGSHAAASAALRRRRDDAARVEAVCVAAPSGDGVRAPPPPMTRRGTTREASQGTPTTSARRPEPHGRAPPSYGTQHRPSQTFTGPLGTRPRRGPNSLKIEKETTHVHDSRKRVASTS